MNYTKFLPPSIFLIVLLLATGCVNTKKYSEVKIKNDEEYYSLTFRPATSDDPVAPDTIIYTIKRAADRHLAQVEVRNDSILQIRPTAGLYRPTEFRIIERQITNTTWSKLKDLAGAGGIHNVFPSPLQEFETKIGDVVVFNNIPIPQLETVNAKKHLKKSRSFNYLEHRTLFQVVTVPVKYRPHVRDGVPAQVTSTFNLGFAYAHQFTFRKFTQRYRRSMLLGTTNSSFSLTPGIFIGPTIVTLENDRNVKKPIEPDRKAIGASGGLYVMAGVNRLHIGVGAGVDHVLDRDRKEWVYQDHPIWYGLFIGFDFSSR